MWTIPQLLTEEEAIIEITVTVTPVPGMQTGTGAFVDNFVSSGSGGLNGPDDLAFGRDFNSDGKEDLYVSSRFTDEVLVYDGQTGEFLGTFVSAGSGGLDGPQGLMFGPDGTGDGVPELYVSSSLTNEVLRYDGKTGSFIDKFVLPFFGGGLNKPFGLVFGPDGQLYVSSIGTDGVKRYDGFPTITVTTTTADQPDPNPGNNSGSVGITVRRKSTVTNTNDNGPGSVRDAIEKANENPNGGKSESARLNTVNNASAPPDRIPVEISVDIPGAGPHTIALTSSLPTLSGSWITIDGRDQDGKPNIILDGSNAGTGTNGLTITGGNCRMRGLIIHSFDGHGIALQEKGENVIENTIIGTDLEGFINLGNAGAGVFIENSNMNIVGDAITGPGNTIAFNGSSGVVVVSGTSNFIDPNSIYSNIGPGIDLGGDGVTPNDDGDADTGPNNLQNFPEISDAHPIGPDLEITYKVPSAITNSAYPILVEFFKADSDGEEGKTFLGSDTLQAINAGVEKTITFTPADTVEVGNQIVATATDSAGNTSEFSLAFDIVTSVADTASSLTPKAFELLQNYPNPFNPSTTINYQIPELSNVVLKVYDVLGNEISVLVNESKQPGYYEVELNATSLPSGIYFYRLQAGSFVETKKMILIK